MNRWDHVGVPHKGWICSGIDDLGFGFPDGEIPYQRCEMCGNEGIRYVHIMQHPDYNGFLRVGCQCAEKMSGDYINPKKNERHLKNFLKRQNNFLSREWKYISSEVRSIRYRGVLVLIKKSSSDSCWDVYFDGIRINKLSDKHISDLKNIKLEIFSVLDGLRIEGPKWYFWQRYIDSLNSI